MGKSLIFTVLFLFAGLFCRAAVGDSIVPPGVRIVHAGVPMVVGGLAVYGANGEMKDGRVPTFARHYDGVRFDDVTLVTPGVALLALKVAGVEGRSSWGRMIVSDAFATAITLGATEVLKRTVGEWRPDGEDNRSFPSGHTAVAYMLATMLHKEYGCRSQWISLGGYTLAAATAAGRVMHNQHWAGDVMVGAGIGLIATELGYYFADLIFKDRGLSEWLYCNPIDRWRRPTFLSADLAMQLPLGRQEAAVGINSMLQGAYFFNPFVGVGGSAGVSVVPLEQDGALQPETMNGMRLLCGPYVSYPVLAQLRLGAKAVGGYQYYDGKGSAAVLETGVSLSLTTDENFGFRLFCDYGYSSQLQYVAIGGGMVALF